MPAGDKPDGVICVGDVCYAPGQAPPEALAAAGIQSTPAGALALLGEDLVTRDGAKVSTKSIIGAGKVVGLYFSAHWCPPCRGFTPKLAEFYTAFRKQHARGSDFEIVFVSSDRDEKAFNEYLAEMPWVALPYTDRDAKAALSKQFKVQGIPSFIILDGATGAVITAKGREAITEDPQGQRFPWHPRRFEELLPAKLVDAKGALHDTEAALANKSKLVYFSAHWCPPCRRFTPVLVDTYQKLKAAGKSVECIFVSSDHSDQEFKEYMNEMPWLAVPHEDRAAKAALANMFDVEGIPTLAVLDEQNKIITANGRAAVAADPEGAKFPWRLGALEPLNEYSVTSVNDSPAVLLALTGDAEAGAARAEAVLGKLARETCAAGKELCFLWGLHSTPLVGQVLEFAGVSGDEGDVLLLLDIPSQSMVKEVLKGAQITAEAAATFVSGYFAGSLAKRPIGE